MNILLIIFIFLFPLLLMVYEKKVKIIDIISPIILCYALGILMANIPIIRVDEGLSTTLSEVTVPLAIPLLLISTNFIQWINGARKTIISFAFCTLSVLISTTVAYFIFRDSLEDAWKLAGMMIGVYTGGTPNMSAIGLSLDVNQETFVLLNAADLIMGSIYLLFLMTLAKPLLALLLPAYEHTHPSNDSSESLDFHTLPIKQRLKYLVSFMLLAILVLGTSVGTSLLFFNKMNAIYIILFVTSAGIGLSFFKSMRQLPGSQTLGNYFLLVFCIAIGSLANIETLLGSASETVLFTGIVMFGAIVLHVIMASFAKIDRDTMIITSVAGIYGPAFVGPIAKVLNNKEVVLAGMTTGLVGYAFGNYLGISFAKLLEHLFL